MRLVPAISLSAAEAEVKGAGSPVLWASASVAERASSRFGLVPRGHGDLPHGADLVIAVGGGTLIDRAKWACKGDGRAIRLLACPSLWGSGAEASKVVVLDDHGKKTIHVGEQLLPDLRVDWHELAMTVPQDIARDACGDTWAHALEGFWSPFASDALRDELADVMREMLSLPLGHDPRWFECSAKACAGQAGSSVGLVHGIAHVIEAPMRASQPAAGWGHARLCSLMLKPVIAFNLETSEKPRLLLDKHGVSVDALRDVAAKLFDRSRAAAAAPILAEHWKSVLRDPCTRTNVALVRPGGLDVLLKELAS